MRDFFAILIGYVLMGLVVVIVVGCYFKDWFGQTLRSMYNLFCKEASNERSTN